MNQLRKAIVWGIVLIACVVPIFAASQSPLLAWRASIYIVAGFAGIIAMVFLLLQPLLAGSYLSGLSKQNSILIHRWVGVGLVFSVIIHVVGLWFTSAPDVIDALLFASPTPFSAWGVIAMWAVFAAALLAMFRRRLQLRPRVWRFVHICFAMITIVGGVVHAMLIEGTMETFTKSGLCALVLIATIKLIVDLKAWSVWKR